jgi:hypothetical protein
MRFWQSDTWLLSLLDLLIAFLPVELSTNIALQQLACFYGPDTWAKLWDSAG